MNRNVVFLLLLIFLLSGISTDTPETNVTISFERPDYVLSQTEMPIYELITPEVNQSYAQSLAYSLFDIRDTVAEENEGIFFVNLGSRSFEIDRRDGSMWYADYSKIWNVSLGIEVPTPASCRSTADAWLREKGILPSAASFASIGTTNATTYTPDGETYHSKILQYNINYEFTQGDIPITGDAAQITVMIGEGGDTLGFDWKWREPKAEPYAMYELIEYESILEVNGINPEHVIDHRLVYTTDDDNDFLFPAYEIEFLEPADNEMPIEIHNFMVIDSTFFKPEVEIITPTSGISMMPGTSITFDCNVQLGTPPYTYEWGSDFDGVLSTSKTFSTQTLSELSKSGIPIPHAISVRVRDAENRGTSDCIAVTIETVDFNPNPNPTLLVGAVGIVSILGIGLFVLRRRKITPILFFLVMLFSAFMLLPIASASSGMPTTPAFTPSAPTGAYDDGVKEIGIEWVGMSHGKPLWNTEKNIEGWYNKMGTTGGYSREFNWGEYSAWESDFKHSSSSGNNDSLWIDAVDFVYYQDHGGPDGVAFTSNHDDHALHYLEMRLGDGDLDSIVFDACSPLAWENKHGDNVFERWAPSLQGIHQICSFATTSQNSATRGTKFATYMTDLGMTIVSAWFRATLETEGSDRLAAVFYGSKSSNPMNPQLDDPINDHAYGFGYVCTDPTPGSFGHYVYITTSC